MNTLYVHDGALGKRRVQGIADESDVRVVRAVMGLRHGFGFKAITCGVLLNTLQQLFGHDQLSTTSTYVGAMAHRANLEMSDLRR